MGYSIASGLASLSSAFSRPNYELLLQDHINVSSTIKHINKNMDSVTDLKTDEVPASEPWFPVMDPISLDDVCKNDLQKWSIHKRNEEYLAVHHDGPFPLTSAQPFASEQVRDSIFLYKERMAKHHQHAQETLKTSSKINRFDITSFRSTAPSTKRLIQQLKAYRRKLTENPNKQANQDLSDLDAELSATIDVVHQRLQRQDTTASAKSSPSKSSLSSRASDLSQKAAKKVSKNFRACLRRTAPENKAIQRSEVIPRTSCASASTSKVAGKVRNLIKKSPQATRKNSGESVDTNSSMDSVYTESTIDSDHQDIQHSPIIFGKLNWRRSPTSSIASIQTLRSKLRSRRSSKSSTPPSPRSQPHTNIHHPQQQPFERHELGLRGFCWPGITAENLQDHQRTENGDVGSQSEDSGCDVRRRGLEVQRPTGFEYEGYLRWDKRRTSVANSGSVDGKR